MEQSDRTQQVTRLENRGGETSAEEVGARGELKRLRERIARARTLRATGRKVRCANCYDQGRDDTLAIIDGR